MLGTKNKKIKAISNEKIPSQKNHELIIVFSIIGLITLFNSVNILVYNYFKCVDLGGKVFVENIFDALNQTLNFPNIIIPSYLIELFNGYPIGRFLIGIISGIICIFLIYIWKFYRDIMKRNYRLGEEHGSAKKGNINKDALPLNSKYNPDLSKRTEESNMILSKNIQIDMDTRHTMLGNNNIFVVGGSGSGKTRFFVKPNILQMYSNYVVIDPKGSVIEESGKAFLENGYEIRYLNLVDMSKSMGYNPFEYFNTPEDVQDFVKNLIDNTSKKNSGGDEFWVKSEQTWLTAIIFYIMATCQGTDKCNMNTVMLMLDYSEAKEEDENYKSPVDKLFKDLENQLKLKNKGRSNYSFADLAIRNYKIFKLGAGKTAKSILISIGVRLKDFTLPALSKIMEKDELHLDHLGNPMVKSLNQEKDLSKDIDRKTFEILKNSNETSGAEIYEKLPTSRLRKMILFIIISDVDDNFSYLSSIILQQLYKQLYSIADARTDKQLPIHTRFINDEFATCGRQPDFQRKINTMRSRGISTAIIIQGMSQIKIRELYGEGWESIYGACPITLFLGSTKEQSTLTQIKEIGGKTTIAIKTESISKGVNSSYTKGEQYIQRDLYDSADLLKLPLNRCLVHINGYDIFEDEKYDVKDHPNVNFTVDTNDKNKAEENRFYIAPFKDIVKDIDEKRNKACRSEIKDEIGFDMDEYDSLLTGNIFEYGDVFSISESYYIDDDVLNNIQIDISNEDEFDSEIDLLPN